MLANTPPTPQSPYTATTITLLTAGQKYNLWQLVMASRPNAPMASREVNVQISSSQGAHIWFGDSQVTEEDYGFVLSAADGLNRRWAGDQTNVVHGLVFVIADTDNATLSVELMGC